MVGSPPEKGRKIEAGRWNHPPARFSVAAGTSRAGPENSGFDQASHGFAELEAALRLRDRNAFAVADRAASAYKTSR